MFTGCEIQYRGGFHKLVQGIGANPGPQKSFKFKSSVIDMVTAF